MFTLASARFNNETLLSNYKFRLERGIPCLYCAPQPMSPKIKKNSLVIVIEMNNELNQVEGIGLVKNSIINLDRYFKVHANANFNRYIFKGNYHINREELIRYNSKIIEILDNLLFKGKTHLKRGAGITTITPKLLKNEKCEGLDIKLLIKDMFLNIFNSIKIEDNIEDNNIKNI
jgi:hypothetical protein